jgi:hypothetical protein
MSDDRCTQQKRIIILALLMIILFSAYFLIAGEKMTLFSRVNLK